MDQPTFFVDVILPLALPRVLTYRVPVAMNEQVAEGKRVIVQLRDKKLYTGLIREVHERVPQQYEAKYVDEVLDEYPVVTKSQLEMWQWIADYYCCTIGEVMSAALPAGLKLASETKLFLSESFDEKAYEWSDKEWQLLEVLRSAKSGLALKDLPKTLGFGKIQSVIKTLIEKGAVIAGEELKEKYKPKKIDLVALGPIANSEENLQRVFADLEKRKAQKQVDALMVFLQQSGYDQGNPKPVERIKLQQAAKVNASVITNMADKGIFVVIEKEIGRLASNLLASDPPKVLSEIQKVALDSIVEQWKDKDVVLLHGVTSSGKTEVYAELIQQQLQKGMQVLYLLPEIALTTQIISRLRKYFGKKVGVYHSGYSENERTEVWLKVLGNVPGECDIILGARSSLFLPFTRLGLIIVDEEHDTSFKQHDPAPRYNARDLAIVIAKNSGAKILLGSATPSIETYWSATQKKFGHVEEKGIHFGVIRINLFYQ